MRAVHVQCFPMARSASSPVGVAQPREYAVLPWWMLPVTRKEITGPSFAHIPHLLGAGIGFLRATAKGRIATLVSLPAVRQ